MIDGTFISEPLCFNDWLTEFLAVMKFWIDHQSFRYWIAFLRIGGRLRIDPVELDGWHSYQPKWSLKISRESVPCKQGGTK